MRDFSKNKPTISLITLGCAKNEVDSHHMVELIEQAGYRFSDEPSDADVVIVNTCSFIQAATEESLETILDIAELDVVSQGKAKLIVTGCMPSRYGDELRSELPEVAAFVPCKEEGSIATVIASLLGQADPSLVTDIDEETEPAQSPNSVLTHNCAPSAYVKLSDGCDRFCSYCTIPYIRGRYHSYPEQAIEAEIDALVANGVREIVLIAQDTGRWGEDLEQGSTLATLLGDLAVRFPDTWFRVMYLQPEGITEALLDVMLTHDNVCKYLDIPLQHVDEEILRNMNRTGSAGSFKEMIHSIRAKISDITLRTTFIAGFPGESENAFEMLCDFVEEVEFDYVGVFPYSCEEGTRAATLPDQIDETTKLERAQTLRDIADAISIQKTAQRIGQQMDVLVLGFEEDEQLFGRAQCQAPDVDGVTYLDDGTIGNIVNVTITDTLLYEMEGERCV